MVEVRHIVLILHNGVYMFSMHGDGQECVVPLSLCMF